MTLVPDLAAVLMDLERQLARRTANSDRATDDMLAADFREFGRSGKVWTRPAIIAAMAEETDREEPEFHDFQVQSLSDVLALVTYVSVRHRPGLASAKTNRSSLWRLEDDKKWRMVFHQGTATS
jgi:hypothetical protein